MEVDVLVISINSRRGCGAKHSPAVAIDQTPTIDYRFMMEVDVLVISINSRRGCGAKHFAIDQTPTSPVVGPFGTFGRSIDERRSIDGKQSEEEESFVFIALAMVRLARLFLE
jgi:hypothetical protein